MSQVPSEEFIKPRWAKFVDDFHRDVHNNPKAHNFVARGSNMEQLIEVWAETGGRENQPLRLLTEILKGKAGAPIKVELHSSGAQKVIFDAAQNYYVTVAKDGDKLLISGIGSVLGNYITQKVKVPSEEFVKANYDKLITDFHKEVSADPSACSFIEKNSNMDQLLEVWAGDSGEGGSSGGKSPLSVMADLLKSKVGSAYKCELHASTGDQKVLFDQQNGFYVTVVRIGDQLLISGIGSAFGNYITQKWEQQISS